MSQPRGDTVICGVGARTHAGLNAMQAMLATRANKMRPRASHLIGRHGEAMGMCRLASIADNVQGLERFVALARPGFIQASAPLRDAGRTDPLTTIIALPSQRRPGFDTRLVSELIERLASDTNLTIDQRRSHVVCGDRGGAIAAFRQAMDLLEEGLVDHVLVGGVDSYFDPDVLEWLDRELRLHSAETENGFIPGEGAAFVLLARRSRTFGLRKIASIVGTAVEDEPRPYGSDEPCHALALSYAMKRALGGLQKMHRVPWALTDVANERHRVDEWQTAFGRCFRGFTSDAVHDQPLLKTGDVGAASAALLAVFACVQWEIGCAKGDMALVATQSDGVERGVLLLACEDAS
jgi:3-oxoacyl-[acyl-carrier-protein] synthase I